MLQKLRLRRKGRVIGSLSILAGVLLGTALSVQGHLSRSESHLVDRFIPGEPQCAHWAIRRASELLGDGVTMQSLLAMLPPREGGHSLLEVAGALKKIGIVARGIQLDWNLLQERKFPIIGHLQNPNHIVVVLGVDDDLVHLLDSRGRRTVQSSPEFRERWSGYVLTLKPARTDTEGDRSLHANIHTGGVFVDVGRLAANSPEVMFSFPIKNTGNSALIASVTSVEDEWIQIRESVIEVPPGGEEELRGAILASGHSGAFYHEINLATNDPQRPQCIMKVSGYCDPTVRIMPSRLRLVSKAKGGVRRGVAFVRCPEANGGFRITSAKCTNARISVIAYRGAEQLEMLRKEWFPFAGKEFQLEPNLWIVELTTDESAVDEPLADRADLVLETNLPYAAILKAPITIL